VFSAHVEEMLEKVRSGKMNTIDINAAKRKRRVAEVAK
jgi:hypothetical protein